MVRPSNLENEPSVANQGAFGEGISALNVIHVLNRSIGLGVLGETNETEAAAATGVAVLDDDLMRVSEGRVGEVMSAPAAAKTRCVRLPEPDRTPRTSGGESGRRCAMQGHWWRASAGLQWLKRRRAAGDEAHPMKSFDMLSNGRHR